MTFRYLKKCRSCGSSNFLNYLDLGNQPLSNSFLKKNELIKERKFPLKIILCKKCKLSQLSVVVSSKKIFNDYDYLSSSSKSLSDHYKILVKYITKKYKIKKNDNVLDIGCNDGILLKNYNSNLNIIGVEPSNVYKFIKDKSLENLLKKKWKSVLLNYLKRKISPKFLTNKDLEIRK